MLKELKSENPNQIKRTLVDGYVISTIYLSSEIAMIDSALSSMVDLLGGPEELGVTDLRKPGFYETMVFKCDAEGKVTNWSESDFERYEDEDSAIEGHNLLVKKWSK